MRKCIATNMQLEAVKTLVAIHGQRAAARIAGLNESTVRGWCQRYDWPTAKIAESKPIRAEQTERTLSKAIHPQRIQSSANTYVDAVNDCKSSSKLSLARYLVRGSQRAEVHEEPLEITQEAKHLSEMHKNLFPEQQSERNILSLNVLIGGYKPLDSDPNASA